MSHNIQQRDRVVAVEQSWHGLSIVEPVITPEIAFPWGIKLEPLFFGEGASQRRHGKWVIPVADDDGLPLGGGIPVNLGTYVVRTPQDLWKLRDEVTVGTDNQVVSAGTVGDRSRFFISTKLNELERLTLKDGSETELLLNSVGSIDKSLHEQHSISSTRIVCQNTLLVSYLSDKVKFRYRHSKGMNDKIAEDKPLIQEVAGLAAVVKAAFNDLIMKPCDVDRAHRIYTGFIVSDGQEEISTRAENMIQQHVECFQRGKGNTGKTEYDLLNGFTDLRTHGYNGSKRSRFDTFETSEFGVYAQQKMDFARLLTNNRAGLDKVEARGRSLLEVKPVIVPA